jgi:hypothetical protein
VYHTTDNFLAAVALRKAISITEPEIGTLQHFLSKYIYAPLNLSSVMQRSKTTYDPVKNGFLQEFGAFGQFATLDDLAKIARFINEYEGKINGCPVLNYEKLKQALQRDNSNYGFDVIIPSFPNTLIRYNEAFWAEDLYEDKNISARNCSGNKKQENYYEPFLSGDGGIGVVCLKSKINYVFASDSGDYSMEYTSNELLNVHRPCITAYTP